MKTNKISEHRLIYREGGLRESFGQDSDELRREKIGNEADKKLRVLANEVSQTQNTKKELSEPQQSKEFGYDDLTEKEKKDYDKLPQSYKEKFLQLIKNEREREERKRTERAKSIEYGESTYAEIEPVFMEVLPSVLKRTKDVALVLENIYDGENLDLPKHIWNQVDAIFDEVPNSEELKEWNREVVEQRRYAHMAAYLLQDFRNSEEAATLERVYKQLNRDGRIKLEEILRNAIGNPSVYGYMFKTGMKPYVFPPELDPNNSIEVSFKDGKEWFRTVYNKNGKKVYQGVDYERTRPRWEGNGTNVYDKNERCTFHGNYFENIQPNFRFYHYSENDTEIGLDFFKTYLGAKGKELYYHIKHLNEEGETDSDVFRIPLDDEQIFALKKFFRWDRTREGQ